MSFLSILGFGHVGQSLCRQAINTGLKILSVADSSAAVISSDTSSGLSIKTINKLSSFKEKNGKLIDSHSILTNNREDIISLSDITPSSLPSNSVVIDCTASNNTSSQLIELQSNNIPIILSNKKPLTGSFSDFQQLTFSRNLIGFTSTVGAGLPIIPSFNRLLDAGDKINKIQGQLSGTIGYIFSDLQYNTMISFSESVRNAQKLGYTEPDPRDDLSGIDTARKALILARCIGINMELNDINISPLYPDDMHSLSVNEFMDQLDASSLNNDMGLRILKTKKKGNRLCYGAVIDALSCESRVNIGLIDVPISNALYNLRGTDNLLSIESDKYNNSPLVISGPGGGVDVCAAGILSDIFQITSKAGDQIKKQWVLSPQITK